MHLVKYGMKVYAEIKICSSLRCLYPECCKVVGEGGEEGRQGKDRYQQGSSQDPNSHLHAT